MAAFIHKIPEAEKEEVELYKQQAENLILPRCGFHSAQEVREALLRQNKSMNK